MNVLLILFLIFLVIILLFNYLLNKETFKVNNILCDTITNKPDCLSYGCEFKSIKPEEVKCLTDDITKLTNCPIRKENEYNMLQNML